MGQFENYYLEGLMKVHNVGQCPYTTYMVLVNGRVGRIENDKVCCWFRWSFRGDWEVFFGSVIVN